MPLMATRRSFAGSFLLLTASAQYDLVDDAWDGCTSIVVGQLASVDGSVMTSHANDCADCDWRMSYVPARDHEVGTMRIVYDGKGGQYPRLIDPQRSSNLLPGDGVHSTNVTGKIPEVPHTHALWESSYSLMNDQGLALGESTCSAMLVGQGVPDGGEALFAIRQLMAVALERCATARCAVRTMGDLAVRYGFYGEDPGQGGAGESVQLADATGEAWVFHITGGVPAKKDAQADRWEGQRGALWAAQRVPDNHVAVVANNFIIRSVEPKDTDTFIVHPGLFELAQEAGLWNGIGTFDFMEIMSPDIRHFSYMPTLPPIPMYATIRMWSVYRTVAPSLNLPITDNPRLYPFSVPVDKRVSQSDVMDMFRTHYEGTEFDMRLGVMAGPFQSPNRVEGGRGQLAVPGQYARSPSIHRTSYTQVSQTGPDVEAVLWFAPDASASSVFVPFFARALTGERAGGFAEAAFGTGSMKDFSFTDGTPPAWWAFDFVANWMDLSYKNMSETYVYPKVKQMQKDVIDRAARAVEAARNGGGPSVLTSEQTKMQQKVTCDWWTFAAMLVVRYNDHFFNFGERAPRQVASIGYPAFWLEMIGYGPADYFPSWVSRVPTFPAMLDAQDEVIAKLAARARIEPLTPSLAAAAGTLSPSWTTVAAALVSGLAIGVVVGASFGRRSRSKHVADEGYYRTLGL